MEDTPNITTPDANAEGAGQVDGGQVDGVVEGEGAGAPEQHSAAERVAAAQSLIAQLTGASFGGGGNQPAATAAPAAPGKASFEVPWTEAEEAAAVEEVPQLRPVLAGLVSLVQSATQSLAEAQGKLGSIEKQHGYYGGVIQTIEQRARSEFFDKFSKSNGMGDMLGTGEAAPSADQQMLRDTIVDVATAIYQNAAGRGRHITEEKAMETACYAVAGRKSAVAAVRGEVTKRARTVTAPPGYGKPGGAPSKPADPRAKAVQTFNTLYKQAQRE